MQRSSFLYSDRFHLPWLACGLVLVAVGCIDGDLRRCGDGYCPAGRACSEGTGRCYIPDVCGNGEMEAGETCDDGNAVSGDGCRADCRSAEQCGNGMIDIDSNEACDCGTGPGTILDPSCRGQPNDELGGLCRHDCQLHCGDGEIRGGELCDGLILGTSCVSLGFDRGRIECSDNCVPRTDACGHVGWRRETIGTENIYALWGSAHDDIYAVGERTPDDLFPVHHYDGRTWSNVPLVFPGDPASVALYDVWGSSTDSVYAVGEEGMVIHTQANGDWTQLDIGTNATLRGIWGSAGDDIYVVGFMGSDGPTLMHYDGATWEPRGERIPEPIDFEGIWGRGPADIYAVGAAVDGDALPGRVLHFDGGAWTVVSRDWPYLADIRGTSDGRLVAVGDQGFVIERHDDGTWIESASRMSSGLIGAWASERDRMFAVGRSGDILFSDGATRAFMQSDVTVRLESVWGTGDQLVAAGWNGTILHYQQQAWLPVGAPSDIDIRAVWASDPHTIYAAGNSIHRFQDGTWTEMTTGLGTRYHSIWGRGTGEILVGGRRSIIGYHDGSKWTRVFGGDQDDAGRINAFWESDTGQVFAVGGPGLAVQPGYAQIVRCQGAGCGESSGWSHTALHEHGALQDVWGTSPQNVFAVGGSGTILHFDGVQWSPMDSGTEVDLQGVWGTPGGPIYAVGDQGTILRYDGSAWSRVVLPYDAGRFPWVSDVQFRGIWGTDPDDIYIVGNSDGLILHHDGHGWAPVRTDIDQPLLRVWGRREQRGSKNDITLFFVGEAGTVLRLVKTR
jgi:cysteine-rich repeat protein